MSLENVPEEMFDAVEVALNYPALSGRTDALAHVGKLIAGHMSTTELERVQDEILDENADKAYVKGYKEAWSVAYNLMRGSSITDVGRI